MIEYLPLIKEFGFPIALCVVLLLTIRHQNNQLARSHSEHVKALTDRIRTLESISAEHHAKIAELEADRIRRADEYAHSLKDVAGRYAAVIRDFNAWMDKVWTVISHVFHEYHPTSSPTPPPPPKQSDTSRMGRYS